MPVPLARMVRSRREALRLTQADLARRAGVSRSAINEIEAGRTKQLKGRNLYRVAKALDVDPLELLDVRLELREQADPEQDVVRALEADPNLYEHSRRVILAAYRTARADGQRQAVPRSKGRAATSR